MKSLRWNAIATAAALLMTLVVGACGDEEGDSTLPAPATVTTSQVSLTSIKIDWAAVTGADSYILERASAGAPGVWSPIGGSLAGLTYTDATVTPGLAYTYRVAAVKDAETQTYSTGTTFTTGLAQATLTGNITVSRSLKSDTVYVISGYVKVQNGATLTIEAGTKLVGDSTVAGSSLWILRGAQINATGTAVSPIVFTSQKAPGNRKPGDWGGLVIVGNGIINRTGSPINTEGGAAGQAVDYSGGSDNASNSGTLKYVRIEFAGYDVSGGAGQELNSLSSYAVGRGTTYEYIQTMAGLDDSFEWWGGAVDGRYLVSYESGDDHFDWTEGYVGRNQFLIALQTQRLNPAPGTGVFSSDPRGFEGDGCDPGVSGCTVTSTGTSTPYSNPVFANFTMIGPGQLAGIPTDGNGATWRRGTAGTFANGVLSRWKGFAIDVRDAWTDSLLQAKDSLNIRAIILAQNGFNYDTTGLNFGQVGKFVADSHKVYASNVAVDTLLGISVNPAGLDWTPKAGSPAVSGAVTVPAAKVTNYFGGTWVNTTYIGAADPSGAKWWQGWTAYNIN